MASRQQQAAAPVEALDVDTDLRFAPVVLRGSFDNQHQFLLDNRMHDAQLGYEVLTPFLTENGSWLVVNRGWVKGHMDRRTLPTIPSVDDELLTQGSIYVSPGKPFLLKEQVFDRVEWPLVVQAIEVDKFADVLDRELFPHVVRLDADVPGALAIDWQSINQQPEKHNAYAVQWFTMAAALFLWFVFANTNARQFMQYYWQDRKAKQNDTD